MTKYRRNIREVSWGFREVEANTPEEAEKMFSNGDYDEIINKSEVDEDDTEEV